MVLTYSVRWTYFLWISGYAKYLNGAGNEEVSRFFCACLNEQIIHQITQLNPQDNEKIHEGNSSHNANDRVSHFHGMQT